MSPTAPSPDAVFPANVTAIVYHTVDHGSTYNRGDQYDVTDPALLNTLIGCGFVWPTLWTFGLATGATAGSPGTWTPPGAAVPATLAAMGDVTASPATAWTTGQHMVLGDASRCCWNGTSWIAGMAP
jgi:hypothetical protein